MALKDTDIEKKCSEYNKLSYDKDLTRSARTGSGSCDTNFRLTALGCRPDFDVGLTDI